MSGFTNLIYFKDKLSDAEIEKMKKLLGAYGQIKYENQLLFLCDFVVRNSNDNSEFGVRIYSSDTGEEEFDIESKNEFLRSLGFVPSFYIGLMCHQNTKQEQVFIANLELEITNIAEGKIDFSAAIDPDSTFDKEKIRRFVSSIKGEVNELYYVDIENNRWFTHVVDREFLLNWLQYDKFYIPV